MERNNERREKVFERRVLGDERKTTLRVFENGYPKGIRNRTLEKYFQSLLSFPKENPITKITHVFNHFPRAFWVANTMELFETWAWYGMFKEH